jgi:hypothetical protein
VEMLFQSVRLRVLDTSRPDKLLFIPLMGPSSTSLSMAMWMSLTRSLGLSFFIRHFLQDPGIDQVESEQKLAITIGQQAK